MDVLSEMLKVIRLDGALFFNAELSSPWCLREPSSEEIAPFLSPAGGRVILYHFVIDGQLYARLPGQGRVNLSPGDIVVFPHGDQHFLSNGLPEKPVDALKTFSKNLSEGLKLARFGGGGEVTRLVCGYLVCEPRLSDIISSGLPKMLKVSLTDEPSGQWLSDSIRHLVGEENQSDVGSGVIMTKLSEVLFMETLRRYINEIPTDQNGWMAGARDPVVGQALALMHGDPSNEWSVAGLARQVGVSRTRLAERFRRLLGDSPMAYLAKWRLKLGAEELLTTDESIAEVAASVGYGSESSFNRAFRREFGHPPAQFRRMHRGTVGE
jgi:AraC-like DNA-binding protein